MLCSVNIVLRSRKNVYYTYMVNIGENLKKAREARKLSQLKLATLSGVDQGNISRIERGLMPLVPDSLWKLADVLGIEASSLLQEEGSNVEQIQMPTRKIPLLDFKQATKLFVNDPTFREVEMKHFILTYGDHSKMSFALHIRGDSMLPNFKEGDSIVIDPAVKPYPGAFVVAAINPSDEAVFRQYRAGGINENGQDVFELLPLNPIYAPMRSDRQAIRIIGTLVERVERFSPPRQ